MHSESTDTTAGSRGSGNDSDGLGLSIATEIFQLAHDMQEEMRFAHDMQEEMRFVDCDDHKVQRLNDELARTSEDMRLWLLGLLV